ncbi:hypothetical protein N806_05220 [Rhodococcus sp. P27]|nr:hypothetical protein N806_05220 [Rhodococcus sp. P27]
MSTIFGAVCTGRIAADGHDFVDSRIVEAFPQDAAADHSCCPENDDLHDVPPRRWFHFL